MGSELFNQVKKEITDYGRAVGQVGALRLIGIISRVLGMFLMIFTVVLCLLALLTFGAVAAIDAMSAYMPVWAAALIISCVYILIIVLAIVCRKPLFVNPFIRVLARQIGNEEELALKTMEAEHQVEIQRVRIENQVENATRELEFFSNLLSSAWNAIKRLFKRK